jgi:hypothetical protein
VEVVAQYLETQAIASRTNRVEANLFGRSAFNRYYYAVYFLTRDMLSDFNAPWATTAHANVPVILSGPVRDAIRKFKQRATHLRDSEAISICSRALSAIDELCELLRRGYSVRVTADYDATVGIEFAPDSNQFSLAATSVTTARRWVERTGFLTSSVRRAWILANGP